ncbi:MAG TPA: saccharopine dehydrogenase C-terminal domain-containing protein [Candidatus Heimdallarchaeota archaeon]|nr:saccharopine dehydrogenase C-terminal domain-containing protein [Candidatus Heimdallarchaeota archaeon]
MKRVLILGAGLVAKPLVRYLLDQPDLEVVVATRTVSKAIKLIDNHPKGTAKTLNLKNEEELRDEVKDADLVISMVPYAFHTLVARFCIEFKKQMVTTSYVSDEMKALDGDAKNAGILILNEIGLDPGIDHMEAMRIIHEVEAKGGEITSFTSYCGGLPAPEANTNPWGYKFSWSPIGVLLAAKNSARYIRDGNVVDIPSAELFDNYVIWPIEGLGDFEGYPNRDSVPYVELYGIQSTKTMLRGTLRNIGWCSTLKKVADIGLLDKEEKDWTGYTYESFMRSLMDNPEEADLRKALAAFLDLEENSEILDRFEWLSLLSDESVPVETGGAIDILAARMVEKMSFAEGERDMIILQHTFEAAYPEGHGERITSTLIDYGIPHGDSAMARTVGLPPAIGTKLILEGKIDKSGVYIPVEPDIYLPVLKELKGLNIEFSEKKESL